MIFNFICLYFIIVFHIIGHGINFYHVATQTVKDLQCYFPGFHLEYVFLNSSSSVFSCTLIYFIDNNIISFYSCIYKIV